MNTTKVSVATAADLLAISEFLAKYFHDKESLESSHVDKSIKMVPDNEFLSQCIDCGTTLMAFEESELCGVLVAGEIFAKESERNFNCAENFSSRKFKDILQFISYIDEKADYCNRLKLAKCLHVHIISVRPDSCGRGVATKLFNSCVEGGKEKGFPAISVDCTSQFVVKIAEKFGMSQVSIVTYEEFNERIGERRFLPNDTDATIQSFVKVLS